MPPERWCRDTNSICDPSAFSCELNGRVVISPDANSFGFIVVFDPGGFGTGAEHAVGKERVAYIYGWAESGWRVVRETRADAALKPEQLLGSQ